MSDKAHSPSTSVRPWQFSLRSLMLAMAATSAVLAAWRTLGTVLAVLLALQVACVAVLVTTLRGLREGRMQHLPALGAALAVMLLPYLMAASLAILLTRWLAAPGWNGSP